MRCWSFVMFSKVINTRQFLKGWHRHFTSNYIPNGRCLSLHFRAIQASRKCKSEFSNYRLQMLALVEFSATSPTIIFNLRTQTYMITNWQRDTQCLTLCCCNESLPQSVRCLALQARAIGSAGRPSCRREWRSQASIADFDAHYTPSLRSSDISLLPWRNSWNSNRLPVVKGLELIWQIEKRSNS